MYCILQQCSSRRRFSDASSSNGSNIDRSSCSDDDDDIDADDDNDNCEYTSVGGAAAAVAATLMTERIVDSGNNKNRQSQRYFRLLRQKLALENRKRVLAKHHHQLLRRRQQRNELHEQKQQRRQRRRRNKVYHEDELHQRQIDQLYIQDTLLPRGWGKHITMLHNEEHCELEVISANRPSPIAQRISRLVADTTTTVFEEYACNDNGDNEDGANDYRDNCIGADNCGSSSNNNNNNTDSNVCSFSDSVENYRILDSSVDDDNDKQQSFVKRRKIGREASTTQQQHLQQTRSAAHLFRWRVPKVPENTIDYDCQQKQKLLQLKNNVRLEDEDDDYNTEDCTKELRNRVAKILRTYSVLYVEKQRRHFTRHHTTSS